MSITVVAPFLNEHLFSKAWLANVSKFADEVITADTGSNDGTRELLEQAGVRILDERRGELHNAYKLWNTGREGEVRNRLKAECKTDWIVPLDLDELVAKDFISFVQKVDKKSPKFYFARFVHLMFWQDLRTLRKRSLRPLLFFHGRFYPLRNWRGKYPNKIPRLFRNIPEINYSTDPKHCMLQYKNFGRLSYYLPGMCHNSEIPFYHLHYAFRGCKNGNMDWELGQPVPTCYYTGGFPPEIGLLV